MESVLEDLSILNVAMLDVSLVGYESTHTWSLIMYANMLTTTTEIFNDWTNTIFVSSN